MPPKQFEGETLGRARKVLGPLRPYVKKAIRYSHLDDQVEADLEADSWLDDVLQELNAKHKLRELVAVVQKDLPDNAAIVQLGDELDVADRQRRAMPASDIGDLQPRDEASNLRCKLIAAKNEREIQRILFEVDALLTRFPGDPELRVLQTDVRQALAPTHYRRSRPKRRTTLILAGLVTMLALSAILVYIPEAQQAAKQDAARQQIEAFAVALDMFAIDHDGQYPSTNEGLEILTTTTGRGPYLDRIPLDPWQNRYQYRSPAGNRAYEIVSFGRDGLEGGTEFDQDISSAALGYPKSVDTSVQSTGTTMWNEIAPQDSQVTIEPAARNAILTAAEDYRRTEGGTKPADEYRAFEFVPAGDKLPRRLVLKDEWTSRMRIGACWAEEGDRCAVDRIGTTVEIPDHLRAPLFRLVLVVFPYDQETSQLINDGNPGNLVESEF